MRSASYVLVAATALAAVVSAQSSTVIQVFGGGPTSIPLSNVEASVVDANAVATTLALDCAKNAAASCVLPSPVTVTEGPSTFTMSAVYSTETMGGDATLTLVQDCDITSSTQGASCSVSMGLEISAYGESTSTSLTTVTSIGSNEIFYEPLTVTGGIDKLNRPQATQTPTAAADRMGMRGGAAAAVAAAAAMGFF